MPEFLFLADAAGSEFGTAALFSEVSGAGAGLGALDLVGANTIGGLGGLLGGGVSAAGTGLGAGGIGGGLGSIAASAAPEAMAQITAAQQAAQVGSNQVASTLGANQGIGAAVTPQVAPVGSAMNAASESFNPQTLQGAEIAPNVQAGSAINTPYQMTQVNPNLPGAMTGTPNPLPSALTGEGSSIGDLASQAFNWYKNLKPAEQLLYGGSAALAVPTIMNMFRKKQGLAAMQPYNGPLSKFHYDPAQYTPTATAQPTPYQPVYQNYRSYAGGGIASLGAYSDGGQMLKGPGDGMSDDIPATIANKQPARLANDEFVVPADVVSHLGNGSSDAGAKQLYKMMDRVRQARTGKKAQGTEIKPDKYMPA
jgi:hypothetical protein